MTLAKLLEETKEGGELLAAAREKARPECIAAVRALEAALLEALGGEALKGLPRLQNNPGVYGAPVRGKHRDVELDERPTLVVAASGRLTMARLIEDSGDVEQRPVEDEELLAEDLEAVAQTFSVVLVRHLASVEKTTARYEGLSALAKKLEDALLP
jgi:hypothetical protein